MFERLLNNKKVLVYLALLEVIWKLDKILTAIALFLIEERRNRMQRNWELIRKILLKLEEKTDDSPLDEDDFKKYRPEVVYYHFKILHQAKLITIIDTSDTSAESYAAEQLTWQGHEFLDHIRSDTIWNKLKGNIKNKGLELSFETIKIAANTIITTLL